MDPRHLVQLATILEKGSITQASRHLHLIQPTLTHNMQTLEMQAGGRLFERSRLGVRSTPLGEMLAREGREIQRRTEDARAAGSRHRLGLQRQVRIGSGPMIGAALLPGLTERLLREYPGYAIALHTERPHLLFDQLIDDQHDLVIAPAWRERPPPGVASHRLVDDTLGVFCGPGHPLAADGRLRADQAAEMNWIALGAASPFQRDVFRMLGEAGIPDIRADATTLGDAVVLLRILMQGRHVSVLPRFPVRLLHAIFPLAALSIDAAAQSRPIYLWYRESLRDDPVFDRIRQLVMDHVAGLVAEHGVDPSPA